VLTLGSWIELKMLLPNGVFKSLGDAYPNSRSSSGGLERPSGKEELSAMLPSVSAMASFFHKRLEQIREAFERALEMLPIGITGPGGVREELFIGKARGDGNTRMDDLIGLFLQKVDDPWRQGVLWRSIVTACAAINA